MSTINRVLRHGRFVDWRELAEFVDGLGSVADTVEEVAKSEPVRAVALYEAFIAGCGEKADEVNGEDELANLMVRLSLGWIQARQSAGFDSDDTVRQMFAWIDGDDYGHFNDFGAQAASVLDPPGMDAFEREVHARWQSAEAEANPALAGDWSRVLKAIYRQRGEIEKFVDLACDGDLSGEDCETIAAMFDEAGDRNGALAWVERGLARAAKWSTPFRLREMRRELLVKLGRGGEALDSAWSEFAECLILESYKTLMRYAPAPERDQWHERAMQAADKGEIDRVIGLWLGAGEVERLAKRLEETPDAKLEELSRHTTEPAAKALAAAHPAVAARVYSALCLRIVDAGKSMYYFEALTNLRKARDCFLRAGLERNWRRVVARINRDHSRKHGFMPGFKRIAVGD